MSELDTFIAELRSEGAVHSDGAFTVSLQVAEEKLQRFALVRPELYIVQLVGAAVASGASFLRISSGVSHLELLSDGLAPSKAELENLSSYLFYTVDAPEYLSELAVGAYGALSMPVKRVLIESFNEGECWQLDLRGKKQRLSPLKVSCPILPLLRVVIDKGFGLRTRLTDRHPEQGELKVCRFAPLEITFDETVLNRALVPPPGMHAWAALRHPQRPPIDLPGPSGPLLETTTPGLYGYLALTSPEEAHRQGLYLVHNGVYFKRPPAIWGPSNLCGVVHVEGLRKNISRSDLVENADFRERLSQLGQVGWELLARLCEDPGQTRPFWAELQGPVAHALGRDELPGPCRSVLNKWLRLVSVSGVKGPAEHLRALQQARELAAEGQLEEAEQLRLEIVREILRHLQDHLSVCDLASMSTMVEPLRQALQDLESPTYGTFLQGADVLNSLLHKSGPSAQAFPEMQGWAIHRKGLLLRHSGRPVEAAEVHAIARELGRGPLAGWGYRLCAELELASGRYDIAEQLLLKAHEHLADHRDLTEERAFLKRLVSPDGRKESMTLLQQAVPTPQDDPFVQWLFLDWMVREGRAVLPWTVWLEMRARASMLEMKTKFQHGTREAVEYNLRPEFDLLGWQSLESAREQRCQAVATAEKEFGPVHSYTQFCRRRAVYQLHRLEDHERADVLQCRGHLLTQLQKCLQSLSSSIS